MPRPCNGVMRMRCVKLRACKGGPRTADGKCPKVARAPRVPRAQYGPINYRAPDYAAAFNIAPASAPIMARPPRRIRKKLRRAPQFARNTKYGRMRKRRV